MKYEYEAVDAAGGVVAGRRDALTRDALLRELIANGLTPTKVSVVDPNLASPQASSAFSFNASAIKQTDQILVLRELATLLRAGITLVDAIESLASARHGSNMGEALSAALRSLQSGSTFVVALGVSGIQFPAFVTQLASTGEATGKLSAALWDACEQLEYDERIRNELWNALTYPLILIVVGAAAVLGIFIGVVPRFANFVKANRATEVPDISIFVVKTGLFLQNHIWILIALILLFAVVFVASVRTPTSRARWVNRISDLPLVGDWLMQAELGKWAAVLAAMLGNRVPIITALELSAEGLVLARLKDRLRLVTRDVRAGTSLADAAMRYQLVGATGINLIRVGERSGELAATVRTMGELSMEAGRSRMKRFLVLVEPMAIVIIGIVIAVVMGAIMAAITGFSSGRG
jgi:general secretion pathway protein F